MSKRKAPSSKNGVGNVAESDDGCGGEQRPTISTTRAPYPAGSGMVTRNRGRPTRNWAYTTKCRKADEDVGLAGEAVLEEEKKDPDRSAAAGKKDPKRKTGKKSGDASSTVKTKKEKMSSDGNSIATKEKSTHGELKRETSSSSGKKTGVKMKQKMTKRRGESDTEPGQKMKQSPKLPPKSANPGGPFPLYSDPANPTSTEGLATIATLLSTRRNIVVLVGAGISVSCGVPDFRSRGTGLYETLDAASLGLSSPEDLFDLEHFRHDPRPFYRFASKLYPGNLNPSPAHKFLAYLNERKMLRRVYTQNVDGLEERAGVPAKKIVQTHGSLSWAACMKCRRKVDASDIQDEIQGGRVPRCRGSRNGATPKRSSSTESAASSSSLDLASAALPSTESSAASPAAPPLRLGVPKRVRRQTSKMSEGSYADDFDPMDDLVNGVESADGSIFCGGVLKPGVTFFGEKLPDKVGRCLEADRNKADALVVIGTSLSVAPMSKVIRYLSPSIPRILVNRNMVKAPKHVVTNDDSDAEEDHRDGYAFDACLLGFCDDVARALVKEINRKEKETSMNGSQKSDGSNPTSATDGNARVLTNVEADHATPDGIIRGLHHHPSNRIFLFPGAVLDTDDSDSDVTFREVAQCDGCQNEIEGLIMKCSDCFDYDLCMECYPKKVLEHFGGEHTFATE